MEEDEEEEEGDSRKTPEHPWKSSGRLTEDPGTFPEDSRKIPERLAEDSRKIAGRLPEDCRKIAGTSPEEPQKVFRFQYVFRVHL